MKWAKRKWKWKYNQENPQLKEIFIEAFVKGLFIVSECWDLLNLQSNFFLKFKPNNWIFHISKKKFGISFYKFVVEFEEMSNMISYSCNQHGKHSISFIYGELKHSEVDNLNTSLLESVRKSYWNLFWCQINPWKEYFCIEIFRKW